MNIVTLTPFALQTSSPTTPTVIRRGKLFQSGEYPDKQFAVTPEQLRAAAAAFEPVPNDLEHVPTNLDGQLGSLLRVSLSEDGTELFGEVEIPAWLHDAIGDRPIKGSLTWDRQTMRIIRNALVLEPRVADAALMSAYAAFATKSGKPDGIQTMHDMAIAHGASCAGPPAPAGDTASHARSTAEIMQSFHDVAAAHGATCVPATHSQTITTTIPARVGWRDTIGAVFTGTDPAIPHTLPARGEETSMLEQTTGTGTAPAPAATPPVAAVSPEMKALQEQMAALQATITAQAAQMKADTMERQSERAGEWADAEIQALRAYPAERPQLVAAYFDAAADDLSNPRAVTFSVPGATGEETRTGTRVDALRARQAARVPHTLTQETMVAMTAADAANRGKPVGMSAERKATLLGYAGFTMKPNGN